MDLSRRRLLTSSVFAGAFTVLNREMLLGSLSEDAVAASRNAAQTTAQGTLVPGPRDSRGYRRVLTAPGSARVLRTDLGVTAAVRRGRRRRGLVAFAQLSDVHVIDHQSPARVEWTDRYDDPNATGQTPGLFSSAYRPQEILSAQVADSMVRAVNAIRRGPVTGTRMGFAIQTGDNSDNCQLNEIRWSIDVLDGGRIVPDSGSTARCESVMDSDPTWYDRHYWHPDGAPAGKEPDRYLTEYGFPVIRGLLDAARRPFTAVGLTVPWYTCFGNHDTLAQGNFPPNTMQTSALATGSLKVISPPAGIGPADVLDPEGGSLEQAVGGVVVSPYARPVTPDPLRRHLTRQEVVEEHFRTRGLPRGHGFTAANRAAGTAYYAFDRGSLRMIVLDTVNPNGYADGSLDAAQFAWLKATIASARRKAVMVFSHHTSTTMDNPFVATGADPQPRVLGAEVTAALLASPRVIAWVNGHSHRNRITAHRRPDGSGGFWEVNTASHIDWPQQARVVEVADNRDGTLSIFTTVIDHAAPASSGGRLDSPVALASLSRELSVNDPHANLGANGTAGDRNTELLVRRPADLA